MRLLGCAHSLSSSFSFTFTFTFAFVQALIHRDPVQSSTQPLFCSHTTFIQFAYSVPTHDCQQRPASSTSQPAAIEPRRTPHLHSHHPFAGLPLLGLPGDYFP